MNTQNRSNAWRIALTVAVASVVATAHGVVAQPAAQPDPSSSAHAQHVQPPQTQPPAPVAGDAHADLVNQVAGLRAEVAKLQAALAQGHAAPPPVGAAAAMGSGMSRKGQMQPTMGSGQMPPMPAPSVQPAAMSGGGGMAPMPAGQSAGGGMMEMGGMMQKMDGMMKMMGMGAMPMGGAGSPAAMSMPSALPGFPGASHIYHIGATGFFLDHGEHITLSLEQQTALGQKKEQALLLQTDFQRRVDQAEQELWVLTAADQPDATAVDKKVQEIARLQGDQRVAFIRAVGEAAKMLTDDQRRQLTGMLPPAPTPAPMPMAPAAPAMPAGGMKDM